MKLKEILENLKNNINEQRSIRYEELYHLTNNPNFNIEREFDHKQQMMGRGLYLTTLEGITDWEVLLGTREYVIPVDVSRLEIVEERDLPSERDMVKDIKDEGYGVSDVKKYEPTGDTFGKRPIEIATKVFWSLMNGFDGIKPIGDPEEPEQVVIYNYEDIRIGNVIPLFDFLDDKDVI